MVKITFAVILVMAIFTNGSFASLDVDGSHDTKQSNRKEKTRWLVNNPASFSESKVVMRDVRGRVCAGIGARNGHLIVTFPGTEGFTD